RFASPTSRGPGSCSAGSRRSSSKRGSGACCRVSEGSHLGSERHLGSKRICIALLTLVLCAVAATAKPEPALAARGMLVGIYDPVQPLVNPDKAFPQLVNLRVQVIRVGLDWGAYVATTGRPVHPMDPN